MQATPEILEADLAPLALELAASGSRADELAWLDPPPPAAAAEARYLLTALGALDDEGRITPHGRQMAEFGTHLFGQSLSWTIKEMWLNVMQTGGRQAIHTHANSFVSGVLYLSDCHPASNTLFIRSLGGQGYVFANTHAKAAVGPFNAEKWRGPDPAPGDLVMFPSSLLHEVPVNRGGLRVTLAFNAIPDRLDAWGYSISFGR